MTAKVKFDSSKMNNSTNTNMSSSFTIQQDFLFQVYDWSLLSSLTLVFYSTLLNFSREIKAIWSNWNHFSLVLPLYIFTIYPLFVEQVLIFYINIGSFSSVSTCDTLINIRNVMGTLSYISVQGLLVARAYALCQGGRILIAILLLSYFAASSLNLFITTKYSGCETSITHEEIVLSWITNAFTAFSNFLVLSICMWSIWKTWKLRRETGLRCYNGLIYLFLVQTICCIIIIFTEPVESQIADDVDSVNYFYNTVQILVLFQRAFQVIIVADFTLDLRCRNSERIRESDISLPSMQIKSVLQYVHQSITVELSTPEDINIDDEAQAISDHDGNQP